MRAVTLIFLRRLLVSLERAFPNGLVPDEPETYDRYRGATGKGPAAGIPRQSTPCLLSAIGFSCLEGIRKPLSCLGHKTSLRRTLRRPVLLRSRSPRSVRRPRHRDADSGFAR